HVVTEREASHTGLSPGQNGYTNGDTDGMTNIANKKARHSQGRHSCGNRQAVDDSTTLQLPQVLPGLQLTTVTMMLAYLMLLLSVGSVIAQEADGLLPIDSPVAIGSSSGSALDEMMVNIGDAVEEMKNETVRITILENKANVLTSEMTFLRTLTQQQDEKLIRMAQALADAGTRTHCHLIESVSSAVLPGLQLTVLTMMLAYLMLLLSVGSVIAQERDVVDEMKNETVRIIVLENKANVLTSEMTLLRTLTQQQDEKLIGMAQAIADADTLFGLSMSNTILITVFTGCTALILLVVLFICCRLLCMKNKAQCPETEREHPQAARARSTRNHYADPYRVVENHYHSNDVTRLHYATPEITYAKPEIYSTFINPSFYEEQARHEKTYDSPWQYSRRQKEQSETPECMWSTQSLQAVDNYNYD
ncbi:hypothetical protein BaRGS_00037475, partial [Batillaria attramentaria]